MEVTRMAAEATVSSLPSLAGDPASAGVEETIGRRREARRSWALTCLSVDAATLGSAAIAAMVEVEAGVARWAFSPWTVAFCLVTLLLFQNRGLYQLRISLSMLDDVRRVAASVSIAGMTVLTVRLLVDPFNATQVLRPWLFSLVYVAGGRLALYWSQAKARAAGESLRPTLVVGAGRVGCLVASRLSGQPRLGLRLVGILDSSPLEREPEVPVLGGLDDLEDVVERHLVEHVIVTFANERDEVMLEVARRADALGATVSVVPRLFEKVPERVTVEHVGGLPLVTPRPANPRGIEMEIKYAFDRIAAATLLALAAPVFLCAAVAVRLSLGRPILFRQVRVGRDGSTFEMLKLRTMQLPTAEELELQSRAMAEGLPGGVEGVDRRTRVGALLRKTSLDELPQLLNVLRGDMSIVGPRPERPEFVARFESSVYRYRDRHRVKSGITGWAQVHGLRGKTSIEDRAEWDNWYVESFSLWLDVKILLMTVATVFSAFGKVE